MIDPKRNRVNYGTTLMPPAGYKLGKAVCTTYSLDLEALTAALVSLGLNEATDTELLESKVNMLHALETVSNKVVVFCESGQTKVPSRSSSLYLMLEKMISPIALPAQKGRKNYPSFHPKTWIIEYVHEEKDPVYRFVVMSRNLTFDRSWDISFCFDGTIKRVGKNHVKPIQNFLDFLFKQVDKKDPDCKMKRNIVKQMRDSLENVRFEVSPDNKPFKDFEIMPLGIGENSYDMRHDKLFADGISGADRTFEELMAFSPFLSKGALDLLNKDDRGIGKNRRILITRTEELPKVKDHTGNFDVYVMRDKVIDGENELSDGQKDEDIRKQDIHAKMYLRRKYSDSSLYVGSMNCSTRGLDCNVEMMVRLDSSGRLNLDMLLEDLGIYKRERDSSGAAILVENPESPFVHVDMDKVVKDETPDDQPEVDAIRQCCHLKLRAEVVNVEDFFTISIVCEKGTIPPGIKISPLCAKGLQQDLTGFVKFERLGLMQLSEFYVFSCGEGEKKVDRLVFVPTTGIPQEREKGIFKEAISGNFSQYIAFILGDDALQTWMEILEDERKQGGDNANNNQRSSVYTTALYERMLRVACKDPKRLREIEHVLEMIDDDTIIPGEFRALFKTFKDTLKF